MPLLPACENGIPLECNGYKYGPITMGDMAEIQGAIPLPDEEKWCGLTQGQVIRFALSPRGLPKLLEIAAAKHKSPLPATTSKQVDLANDLILAFAGVTSTPAPPVTGGNGSSPFVRTPEGAVGI